MSRLFIAIDLPGRIKDDLIATYIAMPGVRWMDEEHLHLTLRFIGDVSHDSAEQIVLALGKVSSPSFSLKIKNVGFFPPRREPRILWAGVAESEELRRLQARIERALITTGVDPEARKFHPHITVARLNGSPESKVAQYIALNCLFVSEPFMVSAIHLYSSTLHRSGSHYVREESFSLDAESTEPRD
ncbi:MAG: RNA 2',3'-cyclic phosphodiesterase [Chitinispirillaceae bacterium]|nr:RNA 2',3'-cyclic phosphodiesterase [Chitinispirillaceae bacterium]